MALKYCVDFDDLFDGVADRSLRQLQIVKADHPNFACTLFTIPRRTSDSTIQMFKEHPWITLAPHGYTHTRGECLHWPHHEATSKLTEARDRGIDAPAFRAPAWLINRATYEACRDLGLVVCDHLDNYLAVDRCRIYRYNDPAGRRPKIRTVHGHLTNCAVDNYIGDMLNDGRLSFATKAEYVTPLDASIEVSLDTGGEYAEESTDGPGEEVPQPFGAA